MTASLIERVDATAGKTVTLATTPQAGDVVALVFVDQYGSNTISSITGLGATWTRQSRVAATGGGINPERCIEIWQGAAPTTAGTVTVTGPDNGGLLSAYLIRGTSGSITATGENTPTGSTTRQSTPVSVGSGQFVFAVGAIFDDGGSSFTAVSPTTGWSSQYVGLSQGWTRDYQLWRTPTASETVQVQGTTGGTSDTLLITTVVVGSRTYPQEVLADTPAAYYQFSETSGTSFADSSGNTRTGTSSGTITPGVAAPARPAITPCATFGGGYVETSYAPGSLTSFSIEAWINTTSTGGQVIASSRRSTTYNSFTLNVGSTPAGFGTAGEVSFGIDGNGLYQGVSTATARVNDGLWHHIVAVWSGVSGSNIVPAQFAIYIDGAAAALTNRAVASSAAAPANIGDFYRLGNSPSWGNTFSGQIDEVAFYTSALTASRVTAHFNAGMVGAPAAAAQVESVFAETLIQNPNTPAQVETVFAEILIQNPNTPAQVETVYTEVLTASKIAPGAIDPSTLAGKRLWLRAKDLGSGGTGVSTWTDQSGAGNNASSTNAAATTVAAGSTPSGGKALTVTDNFAHFTTPALVGTPAPGEAELWIVLKSVTDGSSRSFGSIGPAAGGNDYPFYPFGSDGKVYENFGLPLNKRQGFTPTVSIASWRLYRVSASASSWQAWLDGSLQASAAGLGVAWGTSGLLASNSASIGFNGGYIAEVLVRDRVSTSSEAADLITYFNSEHGLAVPGGSVPGSGPSYTNLGVARAQHDLAPTASIGSFTSLGVASAQHDLAPTTSISSFTRLGVASTHHDLAPTANIVAAVYKPGTAEDVSASVFLKVSLSLGVASASEALSVGTPLLTQSLGRASAQVDERLASPTMVFAVMLDLGVAGTSSDFGSSMTMGKAAVLPGHASEDFTTLAVMLANQTPNSSASANESLSTSVSLSLGGAVDLGLLVVRDDYFAIVDLDGPQTVLRIAGSTHLPPLRLSASLAVAAFTATPISPSSNEIWPSVSPTFRIAVAGDPSPFKVQFQLATDTGFTSMYWSTELLDQVSGTLSITPGVGLTQNQPYYWRARVGDGYSWGQWSATRAVLVNLSSSKAWEYVYENIGVQQTSYAGVTEYSYENVGLLPTPYAGAAEYVTENVGVEATPMKGAWDYVYENVDESIPVPHIWFPWRERGFGGDSTQLYGQGFGTLQGDYHAHVWIDWGPNYAYADVELSITDWHVVVATEPDAYDDDRMIAKGTDTTPPVTNVEHQIVEVVMPSYIVPTTDQGMQVDQIYMVHSGGTSNEVAYRLYPTTNVPVSAIPGRARAAGRVRVVAEPAEVSALIEQLFAGFSIEPYIASGPNLEAAPTLGATATSSAQLLSYTTSDALEDPLSVSLSTGPFQNYWRWVASPETIVPRTDLGTGVSLWMPSVGPAGPAWKMYADTAPYLDPSYAHPARGGELSHPALVFPGDAWLDALNAPQSGSDGVTIAMVAVMHANPAAARSYLFETHLESAPTTATIAPRLTMESDRIDLRVGGSMSNDQLVLNGRPAVFIVSLTDTAGHLLVLDDKPTTHSFMHRSLSAVDLMFYLGRPEVLGTGNEVAHMDLLEVSLFDKSLSPQEMWTTAAKLDSLYRISG